MKNILRMSDMQFGIAAAVLALFAALLFSSPIYVRADSATSTDATSSTATSTIAETSSSTASSTDAITNTSASTTATSSSPVATTTTATTTPATTSPIIVTGSTTSPATSTNDIDSLDIRVARLEAFIKQLQLQILIIFQNSGIPFQNGNDGTMGNGGMTSTTGTAVYADQYAVSAGDTVQFKGTGFGPDEDVNITINGSSVGTAHTDTDGTFTIGIDASTDPGDTTYWFTGQDSGKMDSVMITVVTGNK